MGKIYKQLSIEDRTMIQTQLQLGNNPASIALLLNRSASTIFRELKRNSWVCPKDRLGPGRPLLAGGYRSETAHKRAHVCNIKPRVERRLRPATALWEHVMDYLKSGYSPEQISGILSRVHPDAPMLQVSHETIYTAI